MEYGRQEQQLRGFAAAAAAATAAAALRIFVTHGQNCVAKKIVHAEIAEMKLPQAVYIVS